MKLRKVCFGLLLLLPGTESPAQERAYIAQTAHSIAPVRMLDMDAVEWTGDFWKERFDLVVPEIIPAQYAYFMEFSENNFRQLADRKGPKEGFKGTYWQDGDYCKWLEAQVAVYAITKDSELLARIEERARILARSVASDGYFTTHTQIGYGVTGNGSQWDRPFTNSERFKGANLHETYNMGHFLTLATTHYKATGRPTLLDPAKRVADYLDTRFPTISEETASLDFNPTQIMGLVELYRCTGERRYLDLAHRFIESRGKFSGKTINQNDTELRKESRAVGHAVLANVLYCGAADYVSETGDTVLLHALSRIWNDIYARKASVTGGLGNVHRGVSPTKANENECVHEAFGDPYRIHNSTAYNETCATFYGAYFCWRMFLLTGCSDYVDVMEKAFYNNLSSMAIDGKSYFYTNVLRWYGAEHELLSLDYHNRWTNESTCVCCPTSLVRFLAQCGNYAYAADDESLYVTLYGSNSVTAEIKSKKVCFEQQTSYPWSGRIEFRYTGEDHADFTLNLRIPQWADGAQLFVNGRKTRIAGAGKFHGVERIWTRGDRVVLVLPLHPRLIEAHPKVEEVRNEVCVAYGPLVYCLEGVDLPDSVSVSDILIPAGSRMRFNYERELLGGVGTITLNARYRMSGVDSSCLYTDLKRGLGRVRIKLIPYYAWANRGEDEMSVFFPLKW